MQDQQSMARQGVRYDVSIRGSVSVAPAHALTMKFGAGAGAQHGWVDLDIIDFSSTGIGMISAVFIPRRALIMVRALSYGPDPRQILEVPVRVQRVCMTDRRPAYLLGTCFADPSPEQAEQIAALLRVLEGDPRHFADTQTVVGA